MRKSLARAIAIGTAATVVAAMLTACSSSKSKSAGGTNSGGSVQIDAFVPLTGPSSHISTEDDLPGFQAGVTAVNAAGGVLGKKISLLQTDLGGDPADAVSATRQMLSTHSGLSGVVGLTSDTAVVVGNLLNQAQMATITQSGTTSLDNVNWQYVYRDFPPDSSESVAMAAYALSKGWTTASFIFGNNGASQSVAQRLAQSYTKHGGKILANESVPLDKSSYQPELAKALSGNPQVIMFEVDPRTGATLFSEMKGMNNLSIPAVGTDVAAEGPFWTTVEQAIGGYAVASKFMSAVTTPSDYTGDAYKTFLSYYTAANPNTPANVYIAGNYDSVIIMALAMALAKSTKPTTYAPFIDKVVGDRSGTPVATYAAGLAAIKAGKAFYYTTTQGPISFNSHHSIGGTFVVQKLSPDGKQFVTLSTLPDSLVNSYE